MTIDRCAVAGRVAALRAHLRAPGSRTSDLWHTLDDVCDALGSLVRACNDDVELMSSLGEARAIAGSHLVATVDLVGHPRDEVLIRGRDRVLERLTAVHESLLEGAAVG